MLHHNKCTVFKLIHLFCDHDEKFHAEFYWEKYQTTFGNKSIDKLRFLLTCNEIFVHGHDDEEITPNDISHLEKSTQDAEKTSQPYYGPYLWVARKRKMMPLDHIFELSSHNMKKLFDKAPTDRGPRRS